MATDKITSLKELLTRAEAAHGDGSADEGGEAEGQSVVDGVASVGRDGEGEFVGVAQRADADSAIMRGRIEEPGLGFVEGDAEIVGRAGEGLGDPGGDAIAHRWATGHG